MEEDRKCSPAERIGQLEAWNLLVSGFFRNRPLIFSEVAPEGRSDALEVSDVPEVRATRTRRKPSWPVRWRLPREGRGWTSPNHSVGALS